MATETAAITPGDTLRIERRYIVDGELTCVTDQGRFLGLERVGTSEHLVIRDLKKKETRMFPLHAIAEITLVKAGRKGKKGTREAAGEAAGDVGVANRGWDPGFA